MNKKVFDHKVFYQDLEDIKKLISNDFPAMLVIDGGLGKGKTTLAVQIADHYQGSPIDLKTQLATGGDDFLKKIDICTKERKPVIIYDEAGDLQGNRHMTKFNNNINRIFDMFRVYHILIILCLPSFLKLDGRIYEKEILQALLHIYERDKNSSRFGVYAYDQIMWLKHYMNKDVNPRKRYKTTQPAYYCRCYNLSPSRASELAKISTKGKDSIFTQASQEAQGLASPKQMAIRMGMKEPTVRSRLKRAGIKEVSKQKNTKYYNLEEAMRVLRG